jgi:DNA repair photolyase
MDAGLDFESKILVKEDGPELLRDELSRPGWRGEPITISGVTDCYQPSERKLRLTRRFLEVFVEARQPTWLITKNALVLRDLDLLGPLGRDRLASVAISLTTLDAELARDMEPRTSSPQARLRAIRELSTAGVPVRAMIAPVIPGLNDEEIPRLLRAAKEAGATAASYVLLRLPMAVEPIFRDWLARTRPLEQERIMSRIRGTRGGRTNDARFGSRMRGQGNYAAGIAQAFQIFATKYELADQLPELDSTQFRAPRTTSGQQRLF